MFVLINMKGKQNIIQINVCCKPTNERSQMYDLFVFFLSLCRIIKMQHMVDGCALNNEVVRVRTQLNH